MSLTCQTIDQQPTWDNALLTLPAPHVLQSWAWGDFKMRWGWQAERLLWSEANTPIAAAQLLRRPIPYTPWSFLYVSKGPVMDYANLPLVNQILADLENYARQRRGLFIKIDPDIPILDFGLPMLDLDSKIENRKSKIENRHWHFSPEQIQFRNTVVVDLTPTEEELLTAMKSKWRYNIRLAERRGVTIRNGTAQDIPIFYQMYAATGARDGFLIRPAAYYQDVWQHFLANGQAEMLLASVEGQPVAGLLLFIFGTTTWYMYGASTEQHRPLMPNYLLQWSAMTQAKARGCTRYDMWGAPNVFDESDSMWGVYNFKQGFGGQTVHGLGAYDYPVKRRLYWAFTVALPKVRALWRRGVHGRLLFL